MSIARIRSRAPSAKVVSAAKLARHKLKFHKAGKDESGKCDIVRTENDKDMVYGVVFEIKEAEKLALDKVEELGFGYDEKVIQIITAEGIEMTATTYFAIKIDAKLKPYHWYKKHVLTGARENHLPDSYVLEIEKIEAINDPNRKRYDKETKIYR